MDQNGHLHIADETTPAEDVERAKAWAESLSEIVNGEIDRMRLAETMRNPHSLATVTGRPG